MAKATIVEVKPVKPNEKVTLELSIQEASLLYAITAGISASGKVGENLGNIYFALKEIQRVKVYGNNMVKHICGGGWHFNITERTIPEEK